MSGSGSRPRLGDVKSLLPGWSVSGSGSRPRVGDCKSLLPEKDLHKYRQPSSKQANSLYVMTDYPANVRPSPIASVCRFRVNSALHATSSSASPGKPCRATRLQYSPELNRRTTGSIDVRRFPTRQSRGVTWPEVLHEDVRLLRQRLDDATPLHLVQINGDAPPVAALLTRSRLDSSFMNALMLQTIVQHHNARRRYGSRFPSMGRQLESAHMIATRDLFRCHPAPAAFAVGLPSVEAPPATP